MSAREVIFGCIILTMIFLIIVLAFTLFSSSTDLRDKIVDTTGTMRLEDNSLFSGDFHILDIHFFNRSLAEPEQYSNISLCDSGKDGEIIIMKVIFNNTHHPDSCDIFVDSGFEKTVNIGETSCRPKCTSDETLMAIDIKEKNIRKKHEIQMCCDNLCLKYELPALCG
jgi:hypothetical protein